MTTVRKWRQMQPITRLAIRLGVMLAACLIAIAALVLAFVAYVNSNGTASCVNDALGKRNAPSQADARAHVAFARALADAYQGKVSAGEMAAASQKYANALEANQAARSKVPLGRC